MFCHRGANGRHAEQVFIEKGPVQGTSSSIKQRPNGCTGGSAVPARVLICDRSDALITPFTLISERKFADVTNCPIRVFVNDTSLAFTAAFPFTSPKSTPICAERSPTLIPSLTQPSVTSIYCAFVTPLRLTTIVFVPLPVEIGR